MIQFILAFVAIVCTVALILFTGYGIYKGWCWLFGSKDPLPSLNGLAVYDVVVPLDQDHYVLASGSNAYRYATVVSVDPFVLISSEGDMRWDMQEPQDFVRLRDATKQEISNAKTRLKRDESLRKMQENNS